MIDFKVYRWVGIIVWVDVFRYFFWYGNIFILVKKCLGNKNNFNVCVYVEMYVFVFVYVCICMCVIYVCRYMVCKIM